MHQYACCGRILALALMTGVSVLALAEEVDGLEDHERMRKAVNRADVVGVALLLDRGVPVDLRFPDESTPLMDAVAQNAPELVRLLLERGGDPHVLKNERWSVWNRIHVSSTSEERQNKTFEILSLLLDAGLPIDAFCDADEGTTLLMRACDAGNPALVAHLLALGSSLTLRDNWRERTALEYLVNGAPFDRREVFECLSLLLDAGADPRTYQWGKEGEADTVHGLLAFLRHLAHTGDAMAMNMVLERYGSEVADDCDGASAVLAAFLPKVHGDAAEIRRAVAALVALGAASDVRDARNRPVAFESRHPEAVLALLDAGFPAASVDDAGRNLLLYFMYWGNDAFYDDAFVRALLRRGVAVDLPDEEGNTPLFYCRSAAQVALFLELGADPTRQNQSGNTALHRLIYREEMLGGAEALLNAGALIDTRNNEGKTPFLLAVEHGAFEAARIFAKHGADMTLRDGKDMGALDLFVAFVVDEQGRSGFLEEPIPGLLHFLLDAGLDPSLARNGGVSPLLVALRADPKCTGPVANILVEAVSKEDFTAARRQLGQEKRENFFDTLSWYPGRTGFALALPLVICGLSIGLRQGVFAGNPGANWMVGVNSFLGTAGGLFVAGGLVGGLLGYLLFDDPSAHGLAGLGVAIGIVGMAGFCGIIGGIIGSILSFQPALRNAFADSAILYYVPSGASLIVSAVLLRSVFN